MSPPSSFTPKHIWLIAGVILLMVIILAITAGSTARYLVGGLIGLPDGTTGRGSDISSSWSPLVAHSRTESGVEYHCYDNGDPDGSCESDRNHQKQGIVTYLLQSSSGITVPIREIYSCIGKGTSEYRITADRATNCSNTGFKLLGYSFVNSSEVPDSPARKITACHSSQTTRIITQGKCEYTETTEQLGYGPPAGKQIASVCEALGKACEANPNAIPCECGATLNSCAASGAFSASLAQSLTDNSDLKILDSGNASASNTDSAQTVIITGKMSVKLTSQQAEKLREVAASSVRTGEDKVAYPPLDTPEEISAAVQAVPELQTVKNEISGISFGTQNPEPGHKHAIDRWITITTTTPQYSVPLKEDGSPDQQASASILGSASIQAKAAFSQTKTLQNTLSSQPFEETNPVYQVSAQLTPPDRYYNSRGSWGQSYDDLWGIKRVNPETAWDSHQGEDTVVAIVDSGIDYCHPDLAENIWHNPGETGLDRKDQDKRTNGIDDDNNGYIDDWRGWDFVNNDNNPFDDRDHGTHVAGTVAAAINNAGVVGVAPKTRLLAIKVLPGEGYGNNSVAGVGVKYAADLGADVINASFGYIPKTETYSDAYFTDAFDYSYEKGVVNVAAAGNFNTDVSRTTPANLPTVIAVSAIDWDYSRAIFSDGLASNFGEKISVTAPGKYILSTIPDASLMPMSGTSMAAPHVSGLAALLKGKNPSLTPDQIKSIIENSADDIGEDGKDNDTGHGLINVSNALSSF